MSSSQKLVQCPKCRSSVRFDRLKNHLKKVHHDQQSVVDSEGSVEQDYFENDESDDYVDWYACNSVDRMDGSKYIGYHRREYEDSRFGSFPVHDDYSEESWADDNPWE